MTPDNNKFQDMIREVQKFHDKNNFSDTGGHDQLYRLALMQEELGEISECVTKGKALQDLAEEHADLLILLIGNAIAMDFDLEQAFWQKMEKIMLRKGKMIDGRIRVSAAFDNDPLAR